MSSEQSFIDHTALSKEERLRSQPPLPPELLSGVLATVRSIWSQVGEKIAFDEKKISESAAELNVSATQFGKVVDHGLMRELAPQIVADVVAARMETNTEKSEKKSQDYLNRLTAHYLLQVVSPEFRVSYDQLVLHELINARVEKPSFTKKQDKLLQAALAHGGELQYKKDWQEGGVGKAVTTLIGDLSKIGGGLWESKGGEGYVTELETVLSTLEGKLPKSAKTEVEEHRHALVSSSFHTYAEVFRKEIHKARGEGKNGPDLLKVVENFTRNSLIARDFLLSDKQSDRYDAFGKDVQGVIDDLARHKHGLYSAVVLIGWREGTLDGQDAKGVPQLVEETVAREREPYLYDLLKVVDRAVFDEVGSILRTAEVATDFVELMALAKDADLRKITAEWPDCVLSRVADCFVEAGFVSKMKGGKYRVKERHGVLPAHVGFDSLREVMMAADFLGYMSHEKVSMEGGLATMVEQYKKNRAKNAVPEVLVNSPDGKVLYLTDLRIGNKSLDAEFLEKVISEMESWKTEDRPSTVVLSDVIQGNFLSLQTARKDSLMEGYGDISAQFRRAKDVIDRLQGMGMHVVVIQGDDAVRISKDYTLRILREMGEMAKPFSGDTSFSNFWDITKLQQIPAYETHRKFQFDVVWPYCLRSGRGLLNAEEMATKTNLDENKLHISEYFMLFDVYASILKGEEPNSEYTANLNMDNIPLPGKEFSKFDIVDDAAMTVHTPSADYTHRIFNRFTFSAEPRYGDITSAMMAWIGQMAAGGVQPADLTIATNQGLAAWVAVEDGTKWAAFAPTLHRANAQERGRILRTTGDPAWRSLATRKVGFVPGTVGFELTQNKMLNVEIMTPKLLEKSLASKERRAIVIFQDWQQGSPSAKPPFQAKQIDYVMSVIAPHVRVQMFANGDWGQMRNYHEFANESVSQGLVRIDQQADFNKAILHNSFDFRSAAELDQIESFDVTVGNHEWNSQHKFTGATHSRYIDETMRGIMQAHDPKGSRGLAERVQFHQAMMTRSGDYLVGTWTAVKQVEDFGILIQHLILDKMAKGPGGPSVFQMIPLISGTGGLMDKTDIFGFGHWHYGQGAVVGEKLGVVGPAWAGLSPYELKLGYRPKPGFVTIYYGGGEPVNVEYGSMETLARHQIKDGPYSQASLADHGFFDDPGHDPLIHPYAARGAVPQSALAKFMWSEVDKLNYQPDSFL